MKTIRSVLLHVDATPSSVARLEFARGFALRHGAELSAMWVAGSPQLRTPVASAGRPAVLRQPIESAEQRATPGSDGADVGGGSQIRWLESSSADTVETFCQQALYADLLVLGQHDRLAALAGGEPAGFLESVLIATDKPALILPCEGKFETHSRNVVIGWNATPEAARAMSVALPWLRSADRVHVLEAGDASEQQHAGVLDIAQYLRFHNIMPELHRHRAPVSDVGEALLSLSGEVGADLLVMACYRHSRLRELMLGGASRSLLRTMTLPVLIAH